MQTVSLADSAALPVWRRPIALLFLMAIAMPLSFSTWSALLNNFVIEAANFDGAYIGWLHTVREIPGFFATGVIFVLRVVMRLLREELWRGCLSGTRAIRRLCSVPAMRC